MFEANNSIQKTVDYITKSYLRNVMQIAVFYTGTNKIYGINISKIQTFLIKDNVVITKTPSSQESDIVVGVIDLRGEVITVVNLDKWIGEEEVDESEYKIIIVCNYNERKIGILVKDIIKIEEKQSDELKLPSGNDPKISYVTEVEIERGDKEEEELCIIFDAEKLLYDVNVKGSNTIYDVDSIDDLPPVISSKYLLVAEDSKTVINKLREFFDKIMVKYEIYENGEELLNRLEKLNPEDIGLVITDIEMPIKNGYQVIKYIKDSPKYKDVPVVSLTSMTNMGVSDKVSKLGALDLVNKSDLKTLYKYIKTYMEKDDNEKH
ncbi:MAG: response regulator [Epsilonproteobacteria bacterium]|nr:response regulator [Campylobacterota bacterium]